ncbi:hypothetical protein GCM10009865_05350 [Aeromicrobium ponti]|uniref:Maltose-6'-phosphate glucosidase n=1 Tax=Cytobacillus oceanisediminis TaxID=665099 RepID=A0A562K6E2_9BACI|nr:maltose-6'-phosphate glucosidase [Cytobacillus oceanisediminis]
MNPEHTRANEVMEGREKRVFEECKRVIEAGTSKESHVVHNDAHGEFILIVAESIAYNKSDNFIVILKNDGIIDNLPKDAMVEVAASLTANGLFVKSRGSVLDFCALSGYRQEMRIYNFKKFQY